MTHAQADYCIQIETLCTCSEFISSSVHFCTAELSDVKQESRERHPSQKAVNESCACKGSYKVLITVWKIPDFNCLSCFQGYYYAGIHLEKCSIFNIIWCFIHKITHVNKKIFI